MAKEMANMNQQGDLLEEKLVQVNRVAKVVKGGLVVDVPHGRQNDRGRRCWARGEKEKHA